MSRPPRIEAAADRSELVRDALAAARDAHAGQIRNGSGGMPYIDHPIAVAELLAEHGYADDVLAAALLHDVVEESEIEVAECATRFGEPIGEPGRRAHRRGGRSRTTSGARTSTGRRVEAAGPDALAIYAADKLTNIRALRGVYAEQGEAVGDELKAPLGRQGRGLGGRRRDALAARLPTCPSSASWTISWPGCGRIVKRLATAETPAP